MTIRQNCVTLTWSDADLVLRHNSVSCCWQCHGRRRTGHELPTANMAAANRQRRAVTSEKPQRNEYRGACAAHGEQRRPFLLLFSLSVDLASDAVDLFLSRSARTLVPLARC